MKSARNTLREEPVNAGLDWSRENHAVSVVNDRGREIYRCTVDHSAAGLRDLVAMQGRGGVGEVAIERPDGPVVDAPLAAGITVVVISPNQVKNLRSLRSRYGSAGNKDDRFDAFVLADTLRTDRARLAPLTSDSAATIALRRACRARKDLISHRVAVANQLRAQLRNVFPGAVGLFAEIDSPISCAFLASFDTQHRAAWLSPKRLAAWLDSVGYSGKKDPAVLHAHLVAAPGGATGHDGAVNAQITLALLAVLATLVDQIKTLSAQITEHTDSHIFTSLPRSGTIRAARLLAEIGDCRAASPPPKPSPASPVSHPQPASAANTKPSGSAGPATNNSATPSPNTKPSNASSTPTSNRRVDTGFLCATPTYAEAGLRGSRGSPGFAWASPGPVDAASAGSNSSTR